MLKCSGEIAVRIMGMKWVVIPALPTSTSLLIHFMLEMFGRNYSTNYGREMGSDTGSAKLDFSN